MKNDFFEFSKRYNKEFYFSNPFTNDIQADEMIRFHAYRLNNLTPRLGNIPRRALSLFGLT